MRRRKEDGRGGEVLEGERVVLERGERQELGFDLGQPALIEGTVLINGVPVSGGKRQRSLVDPRLESDRNLGSVRSPRLRQQP